MTRGALLVLTLLLAPGCRSPSEPSADRIQPTPVTDQAAEIVLACAVAHGRPILQPYPTIALYLTDALPGPVVDVGWGNRAIVERDYRDEPRVWAHLFLHLMTGARGNLVVPHDPIFRACGLERI